MPRALIVHYSRSGHTARLATVLAAEMRRRGFEADTEAIRVERDWNKWLLPLPLLALAAWQTRAAPARPGLRLPLLALTLTITALTITRLALFGHPLPNTLYAKVSLSLWDNLAGGRPYLAGYLGAFPLALLGALSAAALLVLPRLPARRPPHGRALPALAAWTLLLLLIPLVVLPALINNFNEMLTTNWQQVAESFAGRLSNLEAAIANIPIWMV